jgi:hypothetical protein
MKTIVELYERIKNLDKSLSVRVLNIIKNNSSESIIEGQESMIVNLKEMQSLVDPDMVDVDLKIKSILWEE